jgi:hypothetical protein
MKMKQYLTERYNIVKKVYIFTSLLFLGLLQMGCESNTPTNAISPNLQSKSDNKKNLIAINSILVAPVQFDSSVAANVPSTIDVNAMLSKALQQELQIKVVHSIPQPLKNSGNNKLHSQYAVDARKMNLDGVLLTKLTSFNMREGSAVGSALPARVDLAMEIVNSESNSVVWQSTYHFQDQALSDNLFKIKERLADNQPKFRSAEEILAEGYSSALKDFSQKRLSGFIH